MNTTSNSRPAPGGSLPLSATTATAAQTDEPNQCGPFPTPTREDRDGPDPQHRFHDVDPDTRQALGTLSEALECVERARGHLYSFHQLSGTADLKLGEAVTQLRAAGHHELADRIDTNLVGRNVLEGRWTFQIVEDYDDNYWSEFRRWEKTARDQLVGGRRHLSEAAMKEDRRTHGHERHAARPGPRD